MVRVGSTEWGDNMRGYDVHVLTIQQRPVMALMFHKVQKDSGLCVTDYEGLENNHETGKVYTTVFHITCSVVSGSKITVLHDNHM